MVIDAHRGRGALPHRVTQIAEAAQVADIEHDDHVGALDFLHGAVGGVGAIRDQEVEAVGNPGRVRDRGGDAPRLEQVPQPDLASDTVAVGVDVRRQHNAPVGR